VRAARTTTTVSSSIGAATAPKPAASKSVLDSKAFNKEITALCTRLDVPKALRHVLAGFSSICEAPEYAGVRSRSLYAIVIAVAILVIERLAPYGEGNNIQVGNIRWQRGAGYKAKQNEVLDVLEEVAGVGVSAKGLIRAHVDDWVQKMSLGGFRRWTWMADIPDGVGTGGSGKGRVEVPGMMKAKGSPAKPKETKSKKRKAEAPPPVPEPKLNPEAPSKKTKTSVAKTTIPESNPKPKPKPRMMAKKPIEQGGGGGKMLQERVDYLSEKKVKEFEIWKKIVLERCDAIGVGGEAGGK
jgi:hypothetical protein